MYQIPRLLIIPAAVLCLASACEKKPRTLGEKIEDKVGDATDSRPHEKMKDAGEDIKGAAKDAKAAAKDATR